MARLGAKLAALVLFTAGPAVYIKPSGQLRPGNDCKAFCSFLMRDFLNIESSHPAYQFPYGDGMLFRAFPIKYITSHFRLPPAYIYSGVLEHRLYICLWSEALLFHLFPIR
ncbi:hypothetical protein SDC9_162696 [bioreactor metagenome]|uniref:Uncharacterized protein n=1 Tax=bioreactor metagenome TaxID=1076179 RepID=A0A645FLT8_9ZZZZ